MFFVFQSKAQLLTKQFNEIQDQIEKAGIELSTFRHLQQHEDFAIPRRIQVLLLFECYSNTLPDRNIRNFVLYRSLFLGFRRGRAKTNCKRRQPSKKVFGIGEQSISHHATHLTDDVHIYLHVSILS